MTSRAPSAAGRAYLAGSVVAILLVLSVIAIAVFVYAQGGTIHGEPLYRWMLREDGPVETPTAILLGLAALFALIAVFRVPVALRWARPFLILFCVFSALMALEEASWGERMFDIEPGEFFQEYSDQNETNFHNVLQHYLKHWQIAAIVLLVYGVILPILNAFAPFRCWLRTCRVVVPPPALIPGFLLGAVLAWFDWPTGREEELGEVLFSLCFALLVPLWRLQQWYLAESAASDVGQADAG